MGDQPGTCAAAAHAAGSPEPDLRKAADRRRRDDRDCRAVGRGGGSPARLMPPFRLASRLYYIVIRLSLALVADLYAPLRRDHFPVKITSLKWFARAMHDFTGAI